VDDDKPRLGRHMPALDGLRAFAVTAVILYHARTGAATSGSISRAYEWLGIAGWVGVDLFFVLSGFLITGILLDSKDQPHYFRNFYVRRTLRIFPLYYAVLAVTLFIGPLVFGTADPGVRRILHEQGWLWTYTTNLDVARTGEKLFTSDWLSLTHLWSLAIEEQFYLVWPLLVYLAPRRWMVAIAGAIVIGAPLLRALLLHTGTSEVSVYEFTPCRLDTLALGALCAVLVRTQSEASVRRAATWMMALGALALVAVLARVHRLEAEDDLVQIVGLSALALLFGGVVVRGALGVRWLSHPALTTVGKYSYGIYVFHALLYPLYRRIIPNDTAVGSLALAVLMFVATFVIAAASWHVFERRFLALKDRFAPTPGRAEAVPSARVA
jgi:peptidoglycan/LPS O-acetylase OafA/YrhL